MPHSLHDSSLTLAIETSNPGTGEASTLPSAAAGVALTTGTGAGCILVDSEPLPIAQRHDDALMPAVERLCGRAGVRPADIARLAVSVGPGGFTAVRIAVASAQMIALITGAACIPVPTALGLVHSMSDEFTPRARVCVLLAWKRADSWRQYFQRGGDGSWSALDPGGVAPLTAPIVDADAVICDPAVQAMLPPDAGRKMRMLSPRFDPLGVARASWRLEPVDPALLLPLYPREPEAVSKWRELRRLPSVQPSSDVR